jgi:hypothetical protein
MLLMDVGIPGVLGLLQNAQGGEARDANTVDDAVVGSAIAIAEA